MAISWGLWRESTTGQAAASGKRKFRLGYTITMSPSSVGTGTSSVTCTLKIYLETNWGVDDSSNSLSVSGGTWSHSGSVDIDQSNGDQVVIWESTESVSTVYGSQVALSFSASLSGLEAITGTASLSGSDAVPARPYSSPSKPTGVSASRTSDASHGLSWTRHATTGAPYTSQQVRRRTYNSGWGSWSTIATLSGTATSYTDGGTVANRGYQYQIVAVNTAGSATSDASSAVYTTPAKPTSVSASKTSGGDIKVYFNNGAAYTDGITFEIDDNPDGGGWTNIATGLTSSPYTHSSPDAGETHQYRVRAKRTGGTTLYSAYSSSSAVVQLLAPPNPPTGLNPNGAVLPATQDTFLEWTHNPVDTTPQTQSQVRHRKVGDGWTTETAVTSAASFKALAADTYDDGDDIEWAVRTWGAYEDPSDWSATATISFHSLPSATIDSPEADSTITDSSVEVEIGYYQAEDRDFSASRVQLYHDEVLIETQQVASLTVALASTLADGEDYTIVAAVRSEDGVWSEDAEATISVSYLPPEDASLEAEWDQGTGRVYVTVTPQGPVEDVSVAATSIALYRSINGGDTWLPLASALADGDPVVFMDPLAHTTGENIYRAVLTSDTPSSRAASADVTVSPDERQWSYFCYGPGFQSVVRCFGNLKLSGAVQRDRELVTTVGRPLPVVLHGQARKRTYSVTATLESSQSSRLDWEEAAAEAEVGFWREPSGRAPVAVVMTMSGDADYAPTAALSLSMTAVESPLPSEVVL